jgi:hypothetical protein
MQVCRTTAGEPTGTVPHVPATAKKEQSGSRTSVLDECVKPHKPQCCKPEDVSLQNDLIVQVKVSSAKTGGTRRPVCCNTFLVLRGITFIRLLCHHAVKNSNG